MQCVRRLGCGTSGRGRGTAIRAYRASFVGQLLRAIAPSSPVRLSFFLSLGSPPLTPAGASAVLTQSTQVRAWLRSSPGRDRTSSARTPPDTSMYRSVSNLSRRGGGDEGESEATGVEDVIRASAPCSSKARRLTRPDAHYVFATPPTLFRAGDQTCSRRRPVASVCIHASPRLAHSVSVAGAPVTGASRSP
jgi:hypothetical protein